MLALARGLPRRTEREVRARRRTFIVRGTTRPALDRGRGLGIREMNADAGPRAPRVQEDLILLRGRLLLALLATPAPPGRRAPGLLPAPPPAPGGALGLQRRISHLPAPGEHAARRMTMPGLVVEGILSIIFFFGLLSLLLRPAHIIILREQRALIVILEVV